MKKLTTKQEAFAQLVVELGNASEAYRQAYNVTNHKADWIASKASHMLAEDNIKARVAQIKEELAEQNKITKQTIVDYHIKMVGAWEELWELGKKKSKTEDEKQRFYLLKEMVKGSDYRGSLDSISKMLGLNEPDKVEQTIKTVDINIKRNRD